LTEIRSIRLSEDIGLFVLKSGQSDEHVHCRVLLIVSESPVAFVLFSFVYGDSWKVKMRKLELEGKELEAEEEAFFEAAERIRESEGGGGRVG
jgi:hypothetical protein